MNLPKPQQELTKKIKIRHYDMSNDLDQFSDDEFVKYLQTLPKVNNNATKHLIISYALGKFDNIFKKSFLIYLFLFLFVVKILLRMASTAFREQSGGL